MSAEEDARLRVVVHGRVQGVGFRDFVSREALSRRLHGFVRNRADRTLELVAEGPRDQLQQVLEAVGRGPSMAWVEAVDEEWGTPSAEFERWEVRE